MVVYLVLLEDAGKRLRVLPALVVGVGAGKVGHHETLGGDLDAQAYVHTALGHHQPQVA